MDNFHVNENLFPVLVYMDIASLYFNFPLTVKHKPFKRNRAQDVAFLYLNRDIMFE